MFVSVVTSLDNLRLQAFHNVETNVLYAPHVEDYIYIAVVLNKTIARLVYADSIG